MYVGYECATCENENCTGHGLPTTEKVCFGYKHTTTNADRIRAMSDEELAERFADACCRDYPCEEKYRMPDGMNCYGCWLDWLKKEVEE